MQERRARWTASSGPRQAHRLLLLLILTGTDIAAGAAQQEAPRTLSGVWRLHETRGELPEQAVRALDGKADGGATVTIQVEQAAADVTVRRLGAPPVLLRVMPLSANAVDHQVPGRGLMSGRAEWKADGALVANGHVTVKQGFLKRRVPFEEEWQLDEGGRMLTVTITLKTPLGEKRRTQVFMRVTEDASGAGAYMSAGDTAPRLKKFCQSSEFIFTCVRVRPWREISAAASRSRLGGGGVRGDYRLFSVDGTSDAPAFVGSETRYAHRVYGGLTFDFGNAAGAHASRSGPAGAQRGPADR